MSENDLKSNGRRFRKRKNQNQSRPIGTRLCIFLFGLPGNEPILLHFLNAVLESDGQPFAKSVVARNPFNPQTFVTDKYTILDIRATDERGDIFVVEFQTSDRVTFADRLT